MTGARAAGDEGTRYSFLVEWFDSLAGLHRRYVLSYFASDRSVEMVELKARRIFLRRTAYPSIALSDLFIGSTVSIYSRQLKVLDYADEPTRTRLKDREEKAFICVAPALVEDFGVLLEGLLTNEALKVVNVRMLRLDQEVDVGRLMRASEVTDEDIARKFTAGDAIACVLIGCGARSEHSTTSRAAYSSRKWRPQARWAPPSAWSRMPAS